MLAGFLPKDKFVNLESVFGTKVDLMKRKGVYPYEFMSSFDRFNMTELPPIEAFYSSVSDKSVSAGEYEYAQKVWKDMGVSTMGEYHDLYLKTDVLLLTDVFENFRTTCYSYYSLDPACYLSAPSLAWDAMLKMTDIEIENITDYDLYLLIESAIRGGMCSVGSKRHVKANNQYLPDYDSSKESNFIAYLDANNLYGYAMSQPMPLGDYKWEDPSIYTQQFFKDHDFESEARGYIFMVDLEYPKELHDLHNDYPLAPEQIDG